MDTKYLSLAAALLLSCSTTPQIKAPAQEKLPARESAPDCSSLDLTQKVGFSTSFTFGGDRFCYHISSRGEHYFSHDIGTCDEQGRPLPKSVMVTRKFAGSKAGHMQSKVILDVSGDSMEYIQFYREPSGKISLLDPQNTPVADVPYGIELLLQNGTMEQLFQNGAKLLDQMRYHPPVCKELVMYKPSTQ